MQHFGVIGSGSFGTAMANILAENGQVLIHTRREEVYHNFTDRRFNRRQQVHKNVTATMDLQEICDRCTLIFPVVPSANFRAMIQQAAPYLCPHHILIHGTKGINVVKTEATNATERKNKKLEKASPISRSVIRTMTEIIREESVVVRVGCLSGPNLAMELAKKLPAATVVASRFSEVVQLGHTALKTNRFRVYTSSDVTGVEFSGVLKNIMAIASGMLHGLGFGENAKAMLITRGLREMVKIGEALGTSKFAFFGLAGIGDLIATCSSHLSRNFTVGYRLAQGETLDEILTSMNEVVEGIKTVRIAKGISMHYGFESPIVEALYQILYNKKDIAESVQYLMRHELQVDVDF